MVVKTENISWNYRVRNEAWRTVKEESRALCVRERREVDWIGHIWCRNRLMKDVTGGKIKGRIEVSGRRGKIGKQLLDDLQKKRGHCKLEEEALDRNLWRTRYGRGHGSVVRQTTRRTNHALSGNRGRRLTIWR